MKYDDFKRKIKLKDVVISRLNSLIKNGYNGVEVCNTRIKLTNCSTQVFKEKCKNVSCGAEYFAGSNKCNNRFCPVCAKARSMKYIATLLPAFERYLKQGCSVHLLTLTIKNTDNFMDGLDKLFTAFRYMTHTNKFYARIFKYMFVGGVKSLEVIRGSEDVKTYHPHLHLLVIKNKFTRDFKLLQLMWNKSVNYAFGTTGEKLGSVHITQVKSPESKSKKQTLKDVKSGLLETLKYVTKVEDIFNYDDSMLSDFITYSKNRRYISVFGYLDKLSKALNEDLTESPKENVKKICKHCHCTEFEFLTDFTNKCGPLEDFD